MMTVAHGFNPEKSGDIRNNPLIHASRESSDHKLAHRLIVTRLDDQLKERLPDHWDVFFPDPSRLFSELYRFYRRSDMAHLYTRNQRPIHRLPAYLAGIPIIDQPQATISIENVNRVQKIICTSESIASAQKAPARIEPITGGIELKGDPPTHERFKKGEPLCLLEISVPGTAPLYTAGDYMPALHQRFPAIKCHIIGREGDDRQGMVYHGQVNDPEPYLRKAHFLVQFMDHEVSGKNILLAYRHGLIPVVSGEGPVRERVDHTDTGFIMESPNKGEIIQQLRVIIEKYQEDPSFWIAMAENGFELLTEQYSAKRRRLAYQSVYESIAGHPVNVFPEISWSSNFDQFFRKICFGEPSRSLETPNLERYSHPLERDFVRRTYIQSQQTMDPTEAIEWLDGVETDQMNGHYEILKDQARFHQQTGKYSAARRYAEEAIEKEPDLPECYFIVADSLLKNGSVEAALEILLEFQQEYPGYVPMKDMIARIKQLR